MVASPVRVADGFSKGTAIQARLAREVLRKLRLAADEAEEKEDRDIICSEVFADITGDLSGAARGASLFICLLLLLVFASIRMLNIWAYVCFQKAREHCTQNGMKCSLHIFAR